MTLQPSTVVSPGLPVEVSEPRICHHHTPLCKKTFPFFVTSLSPKELKLNAFRHKGSCTESLVIIKCEFENKFDWNNHHELAFLGSML